jgi:hypothetical protein
MGQNFWEDNNILISSELNPSPGHFWVAIDVHRHVLSWLSPQPMAEYPLVNIYSLLLKMVI